MSETRRLEQRIERLERQLALTKSITNITIGTFVFEGPLVRSSRFVPEGVVWEEHPDRSAWMTMGEMMVASGFVPEHEFNIDLIQARVDARAPDYEIEYALAPPDGSVIWYLGRGVIVYDADGQPSTLEAIAVDITNRKAAEQETENAVATLQLVTKLSRVHIAHYDFKDGAMQRRPLPRLAPTANTWESFGHDHEVAPPDFASGMARLVLSEDQPQLKQAMEAAIRGDVPEFQAEFRARHADGSIRWRVARGLVSRAPDGTPASFLTTSLDVTAVKEAYEQARLAKERLELSILGSKTATWDFELPDGTLANSRWMFTNVYELLGYTTEQDKRDFPNVLALMIPPDHQDEVVGGLQRHLDGTSHEWESVYPVRFKDGSERWHLSRGVIQRDAAGRATRLTGVSMDITERMRSEHALRESEQRFRGLYENATLAFALTDAAGVIVDCNEMLCNVFGRSRDEVIGRPSPSVFTPEDVPAANERIRQLVSGEVRQQSYEKRFVRKDGTVAWLQLTFSLVNRDPGRILGVFQDITARVMADQATRESEQRFRAVFENAGVGISISTSNGVFVDCNDRLCNLVGYTRAELLGRHAASMLMPDEVAAADDRVRALIAGEAEQFSFDRELHRRDGTSVWINFTFSAMSRDASGVPDRILGVFQDITARKTLEQDLRRTKDRLELGIRNSGTTIFDLDIPQPALGTSAGVTPRHGPQATLTLVGWENFGYDAATNITEPDRIGAMLHHPDDHQRADEVTLGYLTGALPKLETEYRIRHADGSYSWRLVRGQALRDDVGRPMRLIGSMVDITEIKRIETELRESEQRFRATFENAAVGFSVASPFGILQDCNDTLCSIFGYAREELIGQHGPSFLFPHDADTTRDRLRALVACEIPFYTLDRHFQRRDGRTGWVNVTFSVMSRDAEGQPDRILGIFLDITKRMELEENLRRTRERMELGIRGSGTTIFEIDLPHATMDKTTLSLINGWEQFGYDPPPSLVDAEQIRAMIVHPDDQAISRATTASYLRGETPTFESEYRVIHKDGTISWWLTRGEAVRDPDGTPKRLLGSMVNITQIKRIEGELVAARQSAELANRAKDEFLANVSHEIRTPMNAILGMTELALDASESAHQRQLLSTVKVAARNLLHVINDLLDFSKITAGKLALDHADFSLRAAIGDTLRALAVRAHRKGLELACNVRPEVPDLYFGDAGRVRQVLMNLIGNAIKFTPRGEVVVQVMLDRDAPLDDEMISLRFTVRDTGIGIAPDKHAAIFRAFEQEDASTTRKFGGTGLGLTISSQLASLMGGHITVESEPGRGSTFSFTARIGRSSRPEWPGLSSRGPLEGLEVLVVDDNETNREILIEWLVRWRMRPIPAADAAAAFDALERAQEAASPYPLVLLDGRMPDIDGITLATKIRERFGPSAHRLILLSSDHSPALAARSREAGIHAYLLKPVQQAELLDTIWEVMSASANLPPEVRAVEAAKLGARAGGLRVLVAEDNELNVSLLQELLGQRDCRVKVAGDGRTALELATSDATYDVMLLDLHMPEMDGFEVVHAIRERERGTTKHLPIIALTARSSARDRDKSLAAGMDDFLSKPLEVKALWTAIDRVTADAPARERSRLLDARVIIQTCGGRQAVLDRLCELFRRTVPDQTAATRAALDDRDFARLRTTAHMLAGTLSAFSTIAGALASTLEDTAVDEDLDRCTSLVNQLESTSSQLLHETRDLTLASLEL